MAVSRQDRQATIALHHGYCQICGNITGPLTGLQPQVDHIIPASRGGVDLRYNLSLLCHVCNSRRSNSYGEEVWDECMQDLRATFNRILGRMGYEYRNRTVSPERYGEFLVNMINAAIFLRDDVDPETGYLRRWLESGQVTEDAVKVLAEIFHQPSFTVRTPETR